MLRCPMFFNWFDHPLIEAWLERQLATSRLTTSHDVAASAPPGASSRCTDRNPRFNARSLYRHSTDDIAFELDGR